MFGCHSRGSQSYATGPRNCHRRSMNLHLNSKPSTTPSCPRGRNSRELGRLWSYGLRSRVLHAPDPGGSFRETPLKIGTKCPADSAADSASEPARACALRQLLYNRHRPMALGLETPPRLREDRVSNPFAHESVDDEQTVSKPPPLKAVMWADFPSAKLVRTSFQCEPARLKSELHGYSG